jgi:lysophospholipase L1-like esterase
LLVLAGFTCNAFSDAVRIMPLGDSITEGSSSGVVDRDAWTSYRKDLHDLLAAGRYSTDFVGSLSNGTAVPGFTDVQHEGHGGWQAAGVANSILPNLNGFLTANPPDVVLLHIGTNDISSGQSPAGIRDEINLILNGIDAYEQSAGRPVWVVLALIVNRATGCTYRAQTTQLNDLLDAMAIVRQNSGDKIVIVDMENSITDYDRIDDGTIDGEMFDCLHPFATGYDRMADAWYLGLLDILPTAAAGPDKNANPGASVSLNGSGSSDSLGTITTYAWTQTAGSPTVTLTNAGSAVASFTAPSVSGGATLTFRLTITDDRNFLHSDECKVTVNGPPLAVAGADQVVNAGTAVALDGSASSDPGGAIASHQWAQTAGSPLVSLAGAGTATASFTAPQVESGGVDLVFRLTVTDNKGATAEDTVTVHVNGPPVADAGPDQETNSGATVRLDGTGSFDADGAISKHSWVQTSGPAVVLSDSAAVQPSFTAPAASDSSLILAFELAVADNLERLSTDSVTVTVFPPGKTPDSGGGGGGGGGGGCFITAAGN